MNVINVVWDSSIDLDMIASSQRHNNNIISIADMNYYDNNLVRIASHAHTHAHIHAHTQCQ